MCSILNIRQHFFLLFGEPDVERGYDIAIAEDQVQRRQAGRPSLPEELSGMLAGVQRGHLGHLMAICRAPAAIFDLVVELAAPEGFTTDNGTPLPPLIRADDREVIKRPVLTSASYLVYMRGVSKAFTCFILEQVKIGRIEPKHLKKVFEVIEIMLFDIKLTFVYFT